MPARLLDILKCPDHPENKFFFKTTFTRSCVSKWGVSLREKIIKALKIKHSDRSGFSQTSYICPECLDLVKLEPKKFRRRAG